MTEYFILYASIIIVYLFKHLKYISSKQSMIAISFFIIGFAAFRFNIGWDYKIYTNIIKNYQATGELIYKRDEFFSNILYVISGNTTIYLFFVMTSILTYYLILKRILITTDNYIHSVLFFVSFPLFYLNSFSVIRNFIAIAICFYASKYILEKKPIKYVLLIIIASQFHTTALIMLLGYIPMFINISPLLSIISLFIISMSSMFWKELLLSKDLGMYNTYLKLEESTDGQLSFYILLLLFIYFSIYGLTKQFENREFNNYFFLYTIGISIFISFWGMGVFSHRLSLYFTIFSLLLIPFTLKTYFEKIFFQIFSLILFIFMLYKYSLLLDNPYVPYQNIISLWV